MKQWVVLGAAEFCDLELAGTALGLGQPPVREPVPTMAQAFAVAARIRPAVIVLPVSLTVLARTEAFRVLHATAPTSRIVVLPRRNGTTGEGSNGSTHTAEAPPPFESVTSFTEIISPAELMPVAGERRLQARARSVKEARRMIGQVCVEANESLLTEDASLVASELVSNAVIHAHTVVGFTVRARPRAIRIEVSDEQSDPPRPRLNEGTAKSGRGLMLVDALSSAWGVDPSGEGKTVWAQLNSAR